MKKDDDLKQIVASIHLMNGKLDAISKDINNPKKGLAAINNRLEDPKTGLAAINDRLEDPKTGLAAINDRLEDPKTGLAAINDRLEDPKTGLKRLNIRMDALWEQVEKVTFGIGHVKETQKSHTAQLKNIKTKIEKKSDDTGKIEKRLGFVEKRSRIVPPPELAIFD